MRLNPERKKIYSKTIELIKEFREMPAKDTWKHPNQESRLWEHIGKNIGYFWD